MFDRAAVEARLADAGSYVLMDHETADRFAGAFHADLRATLAELDAATAERDAILAVVQRYQPAGSPPGSSVLLTHWTLDTLRQARDAATARVAALEAQVRADHAQGDTCCDVCCPYCEIDHAFPQHTGWPCAVLQRLALAPATGEENR